MVNNIKTVGYWLLSEIFDVWEDKVSLELLKGIEDSAWKLKKDAHEYYNVECIAVNGEYSSNMKATLNCMVNAYNQKVKEYNLKTYWYKCPMSQLPRWE